MSFPLNLYSLAFAGSFGVTLLTVPLWRRWSHHIGLVDDPGHRKIHTEPVALGGGLAVLSGILLPLAGAILLIFVAPSLFAGTGTEVLERARHNWSASMLNLMSYGFSRRGAQLGVILLGGMAMAGLGWWDDKHELKPSVKFAGQVLVATAVAAAGVRITLFVPNLLFSYAITVLWILTVTNALNFMDNMNGLCSGLGGIGIWYFGLSAASQGQYLVALLAFLACGALLGFLPYNFPKASIFLGDTGSHLVGYLLAVLAILPHFYTRQNPHPFAVLRPLAILAVPLFDLSWVVLLRWRAGQPFYIGDTNHLSHRLVRRGFSKSTSVLLIWLAAAATGALAFL